MKRALLLLITSLVGFLSTASAQGCSPNPCIHGEYCYDEGGGAYMCMCVGYTGNDCQTLIDYCANSPCQNGGTCTPTVNDYICTCPAGYEGGNCQVTSNICTVTQPCQNGGNCSVDIVNAFA